MRQSTKTYTKRVNARRAGVAAGIPSERVAITVHKNGEFTRFGWKESATPVKPQKVTTGSKPAPTPKVDQDERNGVKRPKEGGVCAAVWAWLDTNPDASLKDAKAEGEKLGWNMNNVSCEYYARRRFHGISGRQQKNT